VKVHVWRKKEIENYLINFKTLYRIFLIRYEEKYNITSLISFESFSDMLLKIINDLKDDAKIQLVSYLIKNKQDKTVDESTIMKDFFIKFEDLWNDIDFRMNVISGKDFFSRLNRWLSDEYFISLSIHYVINHMLYEEIDLEIKTTINDFINLVEAS
jgi:hypothetical protein